MTYRRSLARTGIFTVAYAIATYAGRASILDDSPIGLVWPAAGVAVIWFCRQRQAPLRWLDALALAVVTVVVNTGTGAAPAMSVIFVATNLAQAYAFTQLIGRWRPTLWGAGGTQPMRSPPDLWALLAAAAGATLTSAFFGPGLVWLATNDYTWTATSVWLSRNVASILVVGAVGFCLGPALSRGAAAWRETTDRVRHMRRTRIAEYIALVVCSTGAYLAGFAYSHGLPLAFLLIGVTAWAGTRLATSFVALHNLMAGVIVVLFTLHGTGPFAEISNHASRAVVAQLFVSLTAFIGLALALGRDERSALVVELAAEKAELAKQREQASQRAELLRAIIDSTADGLAVVDEEGRVTLRNPAASRLLGGYTSPAGQPARACHSGFHHLDGTPLTDEEMPHVRALAGEVLEDVYILIRNPGVPEGRVISVRAATLTDGTGRRSAVVLFHDATAERRHRDELTNFAGVVAHDLLNPVTTIEGWSDFAGEALDLLPDGPEVAEARDGLTRVHRAAQRMRALIDGLLAYTTARDATVATVPVDLGHVVTEVTVARLDAAIAAGLPVPRFIVGDLPRVQADPVLIRQLLDNLIGNAIKYTAPGVTPELTITAEPDHDLVRVRIADNGIGIPAGQHDAIFGNFHRAHRGATYAGTGLGLAICKRIVERHGGTIGAADNPAGGSIFTFTIPPGPGSAQFDLPRAEEQSWREPRR
ncbi:putative multi-sensor signal transduction histidine kinase [Actinoplanes missouriensis 431]|uniref:Sensor-like histidine kinase SenX3 n=1 Tax=Actinoplanes missouriensis (strain ATCC 14538 / DSM 43046 / CBS 188.64 / JCM 3121 / NBRC 102363 / NCIMB 12654 / NRRL B-3342 / UNCC 431) TaxID=512565 RepID=I0H1V3_ACTM4|nr:ATP-binding protein [Actinoplanes missouriensis]BAL86990.1 putative multi-sensor signal transduction histidine kinase [Actinoplanes missouriensis 431]